MIAVIDYDTGNIRSVANALKRIGAEFCLTSAPEIIRSADHVILPGVGEAASAMENLRQRGLDEVIPRLTCPVLGICIGLQLMCRHSAEGNVDCLGIFATDVARLGRKESPSGVASFPASDVAAFAADPSASMFAAGSAPGSAHWPAAGSASGSARLSAPGSAAGSVPDSELSAGTPYARVAPVCQTAAASEMSMASAFTSTSLKIPHVGWNTVTDLLTPLFAGLAEETYFYYVHSYAAQLCAETAAVTEYGTKFSAALARDNFFGTQFHPEKSGTAGESLLRNFLQL